MPISATSIATTDTLETFRSEFNKLVTDVTNLNSGSIDITNLVSSGGIIFEGSTADDYETTLAVVDPTADRTITFQNASGTVAFTTDNVSTATALATGRTIGMTGDVVWTSASFDGSGNVTGTSTIQANSVDLGNMTVGNYVATVAGTTNEIAVTGSGSETAAVTIGLPTDVTIAGDLTISGDDLFMGTNTSGHILVADGTNYNPVAVSGDVAISSTGAVTIQADSVEESMMANDAVGQAELKDVVTLTIADSGGTVQKTMYGAGS